ncbi:plasmid replication protein, CyRepA1 family [Tolypothrix sp. VBCCA 56010]|uniref:plasmid replication protein, CyRepA1 family n=1 Tax=Tolypothrix sp. VBCCA 56010 TaxID=3137731 RepID=UPI003D7E4233
MSILTPTHIETQHWEEWVIKSGVHPELTALNVISLSGDRVYDYMLYSPLIERRNTGRITDSYLKRYRPLENGGWWCGGGIDPQTWEDMLWGQFKPDTPRLQSEKNLEFKGFGQPPKLVKYEPPPKTDLRAYFLHVPDEIWQLIAKRYKIKRYYSPLTLRLLDRRKPISFWEWVYLHPEIPIIIAEGAKKAGALLSAGYVAIALPGISCGIRGSFDPITGKILNRHLIPELQKFATPGREIYFCFDNDPKPTTKANVDLSIQRTGGLLAAAGCIVKVITLLGNQKGVDDFIVANGIDALERLYKAAVSLEVYTTSLLWQLTYKATLRLNQRYLGDVPFPLSGLVGVKSPKGTGKTQALDKLITEAQREGRQILVITHRIQLGRAICDRLGLDWIEDVHSSETMGLFGFGVCIDSVHPISQARFNPKEWAGAIVVLDEVEQVTWHLLNSSTCYEKRVSILDTFQQLLGIVASTGGLIIAQDADLSDLSINFIRGLIKRESEIDLQPWVVVNDWLPEEESRWDVTVYNSKNAAPLLTQIKRSLSSSPKAIMIHCDGQKAKSKWGTKNLESWVRENFPDEAILRIDSESVADPTHPAIGCVEKINEIVKQYRIIIASPSIGTGVSIDVREHFQAVFLISQGVCPESETRQALARLREPVPRFIWARGYGLGKIGNGSPNYKALLASTLKVVKVNIRLLKDFDFDIDAAIEPVATATWAKMASRINASSFRFRDALHQGLVAEGHQVTVVDSDDEKEDKDNSDQLKSCCETNQSAENQAVEMVDLPTESEYLLLKEKRNKIPSELLQVRKYELKQRYGVEVTADLKQKDDFSWYPKIRLHYLLTHDPEFVQMRDRQHFEGHIERGNGRVCLWDIKGLLPKVEALKLLNIGQWFDPNRELSSRDPDLIEWADLVKRFARDFNDLGLGSFNEKLSPIQVLQIVLSNLGMELEKLERRRIEGQKNPVRFYRYTEPCDGRAEIFVAWEQRDILAVPSNPHQDSSPHAAAVPPPELCATPEYIEINTIGGGTENEPTAESSLDDFSKDAGVTDLDNDSSRTGSPPPKPL